MEDSSVQEADTDSIASEVHSEHDVKAVIHDSESDLAHDIATIFKVTLVKVNLTEVLNWVFRTQSFKWNAFLSHLY